MDRLSNFHDFCLSILHVLSDLSAEPPSSRSWSSAFDARGVSWSEVATVPKRKSHRGLDLDLSLNSEVNIRKGWKENSGTK